MRVVTPDGQVIDRPLTAAEKATKKRLKARAKRKRKSPPSKSVRTVQGGAMESNRRRH